MTRDGSEPGAEALLATLVDALRRITGDEPDFVPFALGWATVELDRAEGAFRETFGLTTTTASPAPEDTILGASCRVIALDRPGLRQVVLLEPNTEGRLAATLARHGEGPVAAWLGPVTSTDHAAVSRRRVGTAGDGPFGPEVLLSTGTMTGPHRLLVPAGPGTIPS